MTAHGFHRAAFLLAAAAAALSLPGCATLYRWTHPPMARCPADLISTFDLPNDFTARYRVRVRGEKIDERFTLIAQMAEGRLVLIAFDRFGAELFALVQSDVEIAIETPARLDFRVRPENVLADLHRARASNDPEGVEREPGRVRVRSCGVVTTFVLIDESVPASR